MEFPFCDGTSVVKLVDLRKTSRTLTKPWDHVSKGSWMVRALTQWIHFWYVNNTGALLGVVKGRFPPSWRQWATGSESLGVHVVVFLPVFLFLSFLTPFYDVFYFTTPCPHPWWIRTIDSWTQIKISPFSLIIPDYIWFLSQKPEEWPIPPFQNNLFKHHFPHL